MHQNAQSSAKNRARDKSSSATNYNLPTTTTSNLLCWIGGSWWIASTIHKKALRCLFRACQATKALLQRLAWAQARMAAAHPMESTVALWLPSLRRLNGSMNTQKMAMDSRYSSVFVYVCFSHEQPFSPDTKTKLDKDSSSLITR